jgi:flagellar hook-associated protein 1 FlgK
MSGALNIATRALNTNLAALQVIGNNIANVNTEGYSRQNVLLQSSGYQEFGNGFFGKGVEIATVTRSHSAYLTREAILSQSVASADGLRLSKLRQMEDLFPTGESGLGSAMNSMLNAWSDVAAAPSNLTARVVVLARADELAARLRNTASQLDQQRQGAVLQAEGTVNTVNRLAQDLASVNQRIIETQGSANTPNDLFDQRDQLLSELNKYIQTSNVPGQDGTVSVFVGGSQPLVLGRNANQLAVTSDPIDPARKGLSFVQSGVTTPLSDNTLGGGELAGLMTFLNQDLPDMQNQLGRMALALATAVNQQHRLGVDLNGVAGTDFFVPPSAAPGLPAPTNTGSATAQVRVNDPAALRASDYELRVNATGVDVIRLSDGLSTSMGPLPVTLDGLTFELPSGAVAPGDRFVFQPYASAARNISLSLAAPDQLAAASPVLVTPGMGNASGLSVERLSAVSPSASLTNPVTISFQADGTYTVVDPVAGTSSSGNAYTAGQPINVNGWSLTLRGSPTAGDSFEVAGAPAGSTRQNAGNAGAILALREQPTFEGVPLADGYTSLFSSLGTKVQSARFAADFTAQVATSAESARAGVSGVNLDEEAARLLQFQQSYQAAAKFLQIAQSTFDTLLQTVGR